MLFDEILGQEHLRQMIQSAIDKNSFPQSNIIVDKDQYGGLHFALAMSEQLLFDKQNKQEDLLNHPDLHFVFPVATTSKVKTKPISKNFLSDWRSLLDENPYFSVFDWLKHIGVENKQGLISVEESAHVLKDLSLKPYESETRIMLIWICLLYTSPSPRDS